MASERTSSTVGVLALQGDYAEHQRALAEFGLGTRQIRTVDGFRGLDALVLPGGESTTMLRLLRVENLWEPLGRVLRSGLPVLATCAGLILLAETVENPRQDSYGLLPIDVVRNGYGRQYHSGSFILSSDVLPEGTSATFIRAPRITAIRPGADAIAWRDTDPVLVRRGPILGACFHPELEVRHPVMAMFAEMVGAAGSAVACGSPRKA